AVVDEEDLVGVGVAVQFGLALGGAAAGEDDVGVGEQGHATGDGVARRLEGAALEVVVAQRRLRDEVERQFAGGLYLEHARRRSQVVGDAIGAAEAGGGDDLFVVDAFAAV